MNKIKEEAAMAIAKKFIRNNKFEFSPRDDFEDNKVVFVYLKGVNGNMYIGMPIYVLIDSNGNPRYANSEEIFKILKRAQNDSTEKED